jgi:hypothetical protein
VIGRSLAGLVAAQALFLVAGFGILWALRGWRTWAGVLRSLGLAYLLGVAGVGVTATLVLVAGFGVETPVVVVLSLGLLALGTGVALLRGHGLPRARGFVRPSLEPASLGAYALALLTLVVLAAFFRAARQQGVVGWDAWAFWIPKAKAIYFFGGLDEHLYRTVPGPSYPLLVPAVQAMDFHLMGSADATMLAVQYWFLLVGFVLAVWGLLRPLVRPLLLWPFLGLATVMPELDKRLLNPQADWPLDIFFALAALCVGRWLLTRERWLLGSYGVLLAGVLATKREGQLLTACLVAVALACTWRTARSAWPRLVGIAALAYALNVPWRIWWESRGLPTDTPDSGIGRLSGTASRVGPSVRIVLDLLFAYDLWLLAVPLAFVAALLVARRWEPPLAGLYLGTVALAAAGFTWILWSVPSLPLDTSAQTPIPRAVGSVVLLSIAFAPLLLERSIRDAGGGAEDQAPDRSSAVQRGTAAR